MSSQKHKLHKGILIAIEGIDGAGKTTQTIRLRDYFTQKGFQVHSFKEPTDGEYGQQIKSLSRFGRHLSPKEEFELFLNDRIEDCKLNITPSLSKNNLVFMDRYYFSNIAYQGALGLDTDYIIKRNESVAPVPDLVIVLDVAPKIGLSRILHSRKEQHNHFEREDYLGEVRKIFLKLEAPYIQIVDGTSDEDTVFNKLKNIIQDIIAPHSSEDDSQIDLFERIRQREDAIHLRN